jgi:nucleoside-diphosphate-sugar epimerase
VLNFIGYEVEDVQADCALFHGIVRQYIFISSTTVYARPARRLPLTEDAPLGNPWWDYARKKLACEQWLQQRSRETGFPVTIVRPSHTYSKRWVPNLVSSSSYSFAARLEHGEAVFVPDDGENPWTLTAASDFATGLGGLVGHPEAVGETFHITSDEVLTWNQIVAEIAAAVTGRPPQPTDQPQTGPLPCPTPVPTPQMYKIPTDFICAAAPQLTGTLKGDKAHPGVFDNSKLKRFVPEFRCHKPFRVGVRESVAWLRAHPEQQNLNPQVNATIETVLAAWRARSKPQADPQADPLANPPT